MATNNWRKERKPASFRGVPFEWRSDSSPAGRRTQVHEFVQRDKPHVEDLGRATRPFSVPAFVAGDDCLDKRDKLLAAIDTPGPGELILPFWGVMKATCTRCEVTHDRTDGGVVYFDLEFVEDGERGYPVATPATDAQLSKSSDGVLQQGGNWFTNAMAKVNAARVNIAAMIGSVSRAYALVTNTIGTITRTVASAAALVNMVLNAPAAFVQAIRAGFGSVRNSLRSISPSAALENLRSALRGSSSLHKANPAGGADTVAAVQAVNLLVCHVQLAVAMEAAAQLPVQRSAASEQATLPVWQQAQQTEVAADLLYLPDVLAARDQLDQAIWQALQAGAGYPPVDMYAALQDARSHARRHLAQVASCTVPLIVVTPPAVLPALVLAHRQWGDALRAPEIIQRNRIAHPGFVPQQQLQVARE